MKQETCYTCEMKFMVTDTFQSSRMSDGKSFSCPDGHKQHYTGRDKKIARLEMERDTATRKQNYYYERYRDYFINYEHEQRRRTGCQGMIKRLQNEVAAQNALIGEIGTATIANARLKLAAKVGSNGN